MIDFNTRLHVLISVSIGLILLLILILLNSVPVLAF